MRRQTNKKYRGEVLCNWRKKILIGYTNSQKIYKGRKEIGFQWRKPTSKEYDPEKKLKKSASSKASPSLKRNITTLMVKFRRHFSPFQRILLVKVVFDREWVFYHRLLYSWNRSSMHETTGNNPTSVLFGQEFILRL